MSDVKILAIHLPAFHQIPENDEWWGEGFTEWDNVKSGVPFFKNHYQPIVPYKYYDLSNIEDIKYQFELAKKYEVYGFIFYQYWFGDGKMLFEKPAEMILNCKEIDGHYCFCWANGSWLTTWHGMEPKTLLEQKYGEEDEWDKHIQYLLSFFKDERYIKINNMPVFFVYNASEIKKYDERFQYYNNELKKYGFNGIYLVEFISSKNKEVVGNITKAVTEFEPLYTTFFDVNKLELFKRFLCKKMKFVDYQSYDKLWGYKLNRERTYQEKSIIKSCFPSWDNSSRKGKQSMIVKGSSPEKFKKYLKLLINTHRKNEDKEFLVINAWNEWSEGAYLEPDSKHKAKYLEAIKSVVKET